MLTFLSRLVGAYRGRQGMQKATKRVRITLWRQILEYGDVEVTVPLNASLDQIIEAAVASRPRKMRRASDFGAI